MTTMRILDLPNIAADNRHSAIVRLTAQQILDNETGYFKPGDWLRSLALCDLLQMCVCIDAVQVTAPANHPTVIQMKTLSALLAQGEGVDVDLGDLSSKVLILIHLLLEELTARHAGEPLDYDRITFSEDDGGLRGYPQPTEPEQE